MLWHASLLALTLLLFSSATEARLKNVPDSARLELAAVRELVLPQEASEKLQAAVADLRDVWVERVPGVTGLELAAGDPRKFSIVLEYRVVPSWNL